MRVPRSSLFALFLVGCASTLVGGLAAQGLWAPLTFPAGPTARFGGSMAYDGARDRLVLISGMPTIFGGMQETWENDGAQWIFRGTVGPYGAIGETGAVYDSARQVTVAVQSSGPSGQFQTWEWAGASWVLRTPVTSPSARTGFVMAYDSTRQRTVLFGGRAGSTHFAETWEWNGTTWSLRSTGGPVGRIHSAMAFDSVRGVSVLFGGYNDANPTMYSDTWEWNGTYWLQPIGAAGPGPRYEHAMVFDALRNRIVMLGGRTQSGQDVQDTWEWNGTAWANMLALPPLPGGPAVAFDTTRQRTVSFGGRFFASNIQGGTFAYGATSVLASVTPYGAGCVGPLGEPTLTVQSGSARLGSALTLRVGSLPTGLLNVPIGWLGFDNTNWNGVPLPWALDPFGFPGCSALLAPTASYTLSNSGGFANWSLAIPFLPAAAGLHFYTQGGVVVLGFNPGGLVFTRGMHAVIGR